MWEKTEALNQLLDQKGWRSESIPKGAPVWAFYFNLLGDVLIPNPDIVKVLELLKLLVQMSDYKDYFLRNAAFAVDLRSNRRYIQWDSIWDVPASRQKHCLTIRQWLEENGVDVDKVIASTADGSEQEITADKQ